MEGFEPVFRRVFVLNTASFEGSGHLGFAIFCWGDELNYPDMCLVP